MQRTSVRVAGALLLALGLLGGMSAGLAATTVADVAAPNALLAASPSAYVRMHAGNPVRWQPWTRAALQQARRENKPIFVTVGFYACFWCHEMDRTVFANPQVAALLNRDFINLVVDREQRPDLDQNFVLAREILDHGQSGWPNNLVLTPQGLPFAAFGVLPPRTTPQQAGFVEVMQRIHTAWTREPQVVQAQADKVRAAMREVQQASSQPGAIEPERWRSEALAEATKSFDPLDGGFDAGSDRFPHAPLLAFLQSTAEPKAAEMLRTTLRAMAEGGIMDQLGGGFHRYAIDPQWSVPHFEKMLTDNAQLLAVYAKAAQAEHDPLFAQVAQRTAAFMLRDLRLPGGAFASAINAETGGAEGESYVWSAAQIRAVLGDADAQRLLRIYALSAMPPEPGSDRQPAGGVLRIAPAASHGLSDAELAAAIRQLAPLRERLLAARRERRQPGRDDKAVLAGNGLAIAALAKAGARLRQPAWTAAAQAAAQVLWHAAWNPREHGLAHEVVAGKLGGPGLLADYALFGQGLLALHQATGQSVWLWRAEQVAAAMQQRFSNADGSLRSTWDLSLPVEPAALGDSHEPSAQSAAVAFWLTLAQASGKVVYADSARRALTSFAGFVQRAPVGFASVLAVLGPGSQTARLLAGSVMARTDATAHATLSAPTPRPAGVTQAASGKTAAPPTSAQPAEDSARVVQATAQLQTQPTQQVRVQVQVSPGYHVNANPASQRYLIPTTLLVDGKPASGVNYPQGRSLRLQTGMTLSVLEGHIALVLPSPGVAPTRSQLRVQACYDRACLPPSTLDLAVRR